MALFPCLLNVQSRCRSLEQHLFYSENNTFRMKDEPGMKKTRWQNISGWKIIPFSQKGHLFLTWAQPLFVIYVTTSSCPHWPPFIFSTLFFCFLLALSSPPVLFLLCFISTHLPDPPLPPNIILIFLLSCFHSWPSLHHIPLSYLSLLAWECACWRGDRKQETRMSGWCFACLLSGNRKISSEGFDTSRVCSKWWDDKRGCVWEEKG